MIRRSVSAGEGAAGPKTRQERRGATCCRVKWRSVSARRVVRSGSRRGDMGKKILGSAHERRTETKGFDRARHNLGRSDPDSLSAGSTFCHADEAHGAERQASVKNALLVVMDQAG